MEHNSTNLKTADFLKTSDVLEYDFPFGLFEIIVSDTISLVSANEFFYKFLGTSYNDYNNGLFCRFGNTDRIMYENYIKDKSIDKENFTLEFKINKKSDVVVWAQMEARFAGIEGAGKKYVCVLWDISKRKHMESELSELKNLYLKAISSGDEIIFDYQIDKDIFVYYKLVEEDGIITNKPNARTDFLKNSEANQDIYPDDIVYFGELIKENISHPFDVRFRRSHQKPGEYTKMRVHASVERDTNGNASKIIGTIRPIEDVKYNTEDDALINEKDQLTGINSRSAAKKKIEEFLLSSSVDSPYALLILDVKGFKTVNESYGHIFGDNVLIQVADIIIENIGQNDIVGRLGGDEFIIFIKNVSEAAVNAICDKLRRDICNIYVGEDAKIDVSIGAIVEKNHSITCQQLIQTADSALYELISKDCKGVNIAKEIDNTAKELKLSYVADMNIRSAPKNTEKRLSELIFELLEQARDLDKALDTVLALVGEKKELSRVTMFRRDGGQLCLTKQWVSRGMQAKNAEESSVLIEYDSKMKENFQEDGMGVINAESANRFDPERAQEILSDGAKSIMYCNMMEFGEVVGVIAFVDCEKEREWSSIDYKAFRTITRMISAYTYKAEAIRKDN